MYWLQYEYLRGASSPVCPASLPTGHHLTENIVPTDGPLGRANRAWPPGNASTKAHQVMALTQDLQLGSSD